ncbi:MAG TPA: sigma factor-like helix-turn-helix DNA-binding protein [Solirubrobacteraceae bacterium]|nr:sigma factor-like helix-turn-helix DNA-binding protein [Solirubrobacteraceae bacterium]
MSRLDDLPPDQRATLSLLLRRGKSYAEVADMLEIEERAVHDRAHAALAVLAAKEARALSAEQRAELGDYLLGQSPGVAERLAARTLLDGSEPARAWAGAVAGELRPLAGTALPEIPNGSRPAAAETPPPTASEPASAPARRSPGPTPSSRTSPSRTPSSRVGGALLLAALVAGVVVAVVLLTSGGGSSSNSSSTGSSSAAETGTGTQKAQAKEDKRITLTPPNASSRSVGVAEVLSEGSQYAFYLAAQHVPPTKGKGFFYAVWLYNSPGSYEPLSRAPEVGANGNFQGGALLPKDAAKYHTMILTRETDPKPTKPGPIVLRGAFALH